MSHDPYLPSTDWSRVVYPCKVRCINSYGESSVLEVGEIYTAEKYLNPISLGEAERLAIHLPGLWPALGVRHHQLGVMNYFANRFELVSAKDNPVSAKDNTARTLHYADDEMAGIF